MTPYDAFCASSIAHRVRGVHAGAGWFNVCCIFCGEGNWNLTIHQEQGHFRCWICGAHGGWSRLRWALAERALEGPWREVDVARRAHYVDEQPARAAALAAYLRPFETYTAVHTADWPWWCYLALERGLAPSLIRQARPLVGLDARPVGGHDLRAYVGFACGGCGFSARRIAGSGPRWLNRRLDGTPLVYGAEAVQRVQPGAVVLTEGVFDALSVAYGHGVAVLGSGAPPAALGVLVGALPRTVRSVVIGYDRDVPQASLRELRLVLQAVGLRVGVWSWTAYPTTVTDLDEVRRHCGVDGVRDGIGVALGRFAGVVPRRLWSG